MSEPKKTAAKKESKAEAKATAEPKAPRRPIVTKDLRISLSSVESTMPFAVGDELSVEVKGATVVLSKAEKK